MESKELATKNICLLYGWATKRYDAWHRRHPNETYEELVSLASLRFVEAVTDWPQRGSHRVKLSTWVYRRLDWFMMKEIDAVNQVVSSPVYSFSKASKETFLAAENARKTKQLDKMHPRTWAVDRDPADVAEFRETVTLLKKYMRKLNRNQRETVQLYADYSFAEISRKKKICKQRAIQLFSKSRKKILKLMEADGIDISSFCLIWPRWNQN